MRLLAFVLLVASAAAQTSAGEDEKLDNLRKLELAKTPLDNLPPTDVVKARHELTEQDILAEDPEALFIGRDVESLTHPPILSKVPEEHQGRGFIKGYKELCAYLLQVSLGVNETESLHGPRLYNIAARLECSWTACRMCQQRMIHVFDYCTRNGVEDHAMHGVCEHENPIIQATRLKKMIFPENPESCRLWRDMQVLGVRCGPSDAAFCQGAHTVSDMCHALGLNSKSFLQGRPLASLASWFCQQTHSCSSGALLNAGPGIEDTTPSFGNEVAPVAADY